MEFQEPKFEVIEFDSEDVIATSNPGGVVTCTVGTLVGDVTCTVVGKLIV